MKLFAFVLALLLLAGAVDPTRGWLITLVVFTGIATFRPRLGLGFRVRPAFDVRLAAFVLAVLLLAGTVAPTRDWLIALSAVTGVAAFMPGVPFGLDHRRESRWCRTWLDRWPDRMDLEWDRWERRMDRRMARHARRGGGSWS